MRVKQALAIVLVASMLTAFLAVSPGYSWVAWETGKSEQFGPRADRLIFYAYTNPELEYDALEIGEIDFVEWTMTKERMDKYLTQPEWAEKIGVAEYYERGMYQIDLNCNLTFPTENYMGVPQLDAYLGTVNPTNDIWFRRALSYLADKARYVSEVRKGLAGVLDTVLDPPPPFGPFEEYEGYYYDGPPYYYFDPSEAAAILDANGWEDIEPNGERNIPQWIADIETGGERVDFTDLWPSGLVAVMRTDKPDWMAWSNLFADECENIGIPVFRDAKDRLPAIYQVIVFLQFHLYFGGWSFGTDPTYTRDLWYSALCTGPGTFNINYANYSNPAFDAGADLLYFAPSAEDARTAAQGAQRMIKEDVPCIPLVYYSGAKGYSRKYVGGEAPYTGLTWEGMVNELGFGINTRWTKKNMHPEGYEVGDGTTMTIRAGLSTDVQSINPVTAYMYYDYEIMYMYNYPTWLEYDPYHPGPIWEEPEIPWLAWDFYEETWDATGIMDPTAPGYPDATKITFFFRDDVTFHDGTPLTAYDAEFSVLFKQKCGIDVAWNYPLVEHVYSTNVLDPYTLEVYFDVQSIFALHWVGYDGGAILPKHIWETAEDTAGRNWTDPLWDPFEAVYELDMFAPENAKYHINAGMYVWTGDFVRGSYYVLEAYNDEYFNLSPIRLYCTNWTPLVPGDVQKVAIDIHNYKWVAEEVTVHVEVNDIEVAVFTTTVEAGRGAYPGIKRVLLKDLPLGVVTCYSEPVQGVPTWDASCIPRFTPRGDVNFDGAIDIFDAAGIFALAFGATLDPLHPRWNRRCDIMRDFVIDIYDAIALASMFGFPRA